MQINFLHAQVLQEVFLYRNIEFEIIKNAVDLTRFSANKTEIEKKNIATKRKNMGLDNKIVIGHIGRFNTQKNHKFLINVFKEIRKNIVIRFYF